MNNLGKFRESHDWKENLSVRDVMICEMVCGSHIPLGFNELKRKTGIHQEKLSRVLRRLVNYGFIIKIDSKYASCC